MCGTENRTELPLATSASGCGCCSSESSSVAVAVAAAAPADAAEFVVEGLTCRHCVQTVEKAVAALDGVGSVAVELVPGGRSRLIINGTANYAAVREAVTSAGYTAV